MKLTKLQRHTAYILMYDKLEDWRITTFCSIWFSFFGDNSWRLLSNTLPELYRKRTRGRHSYEAWFNGYEERRIAIKKCISETA